MATGIDWLLVAVALVLLTAAADVKKAEPPRPMVTLALSIEHPSQKAIKGTPERVQRNRAR
jgi:hypothetical protein